MTPDNAATTCARHIPVPSTSATARPCDPTTRHGAHHPNGSPGGGSDGTRASSPPRHNRRMPWSNNRPRAKRYDAEHTATRARHMTALQRARVGVCAEVRNPGSRCLHPSPLIYPTDELHLCHNRRTGAVIGLGHADCNRAEGARHARRKQRHHTRRQSALVW